MEAMFTGQEGWFVTRWANLRSAWLQVAHHLSGPDRPARGGSWTEHGSHACVWEPHVDDLFMVIDESTARLAQSAERKALNLVVVGSSPTVGDCSSCAAHTNL